MAFFKGLAKVFVVFFNIVLAVLGITFIVIGGLLANAFKAYTNGAVIKVELIWGPVAGLLVLGLWLVITSGCGIIAVIGSNLGLAKSYLALLSIIVLIEIVLAICFIVYKQPINNAIDDAISSTMNKAYAKVNPDTSLQSSLDKLQRDLKCCGNNGPNDYANSSLTINNPPDSCCVTFSTGCATSTDPARSKLFQQGCKTEVDRLITKYLNAIIASGSIFAVLEVIAIVYTCVIVKELAKKGLVRFT